MKIVLLSLILQASLAEMNFAQYGSCVNQTLFESSGGASGYHCHFTSDVCLDGEVWFTPAKTDANFISCTCDHDYNDNVFVQACYSMVTHAVSCAADVASCPEGAFMMGSRYNSHQTVNELCRDGVSAYGHGSPESCGKQCTCNYDYRSRSDPVEVGSTSYGKCYSPKTNLQFCAAKESVCAMDEEYRSPHHATFTGPECNCDRTHTGACVTMPSIGEYQFGHCAVAVDSCNDGESFLTATALKTSGLANDCRLCENTWDSPTVSPAPTAVVTAPPTLSPTVSAAPSLSQKPTNTPTTADPTPAPSATDSDKPTRAPTAADTDKPTEKPTDKPVSVPTAPPQKKPEESCVDNMSYRFKDKKKKSCIWISNTPKRTANLCKKKGVKPNCKIVCGECCGDDPKLRFKIGQKPNQKKRGCSYLSNDTRKNKFCPKAYVKAICAKTCGRCCSNVPDYEVVTPNEDTKKCNWVSGNANRKRRYCKVDEVRKNCARECDSCADYTIKNTKPPVPAPTAAPVPAPTAAPVPAPTAAPVPDPTAAPVRAPVSLDDD